MTNTETNTGRTSERTDSFSRPFNRREMGARYELRTADYLEAKDYQILERNYLCPLGEIDLIAAKGDVLVFVEVKYRANRSYGCSEDAVDRRKQRRIRRVAQWYLADHPGMQCMYCRYDVAAYQPDDRLVYYVNAFGGM